MADKTWNGEPFWGLGYEWDPDWVLTERQKELRAEHAAELQALLDRAGVDADPAAFRRYGSARRLYTFDVDDAGAYG